MPLLPHLRRGSGDRLVLCYHGITTDERALLRVPAGDLRRQLSSLLDRGYAAVTFAEAVSAPSGALTLAVTFDDAEPNVLVLALPVLQELGIPATVFAPVDQVGVRALSWDDLAALAAAGWEIGSHTLSHAHLPELDGTALERELRGSRAAIEDALGRPCRSLAYPFGEVDARVRAAAAAAGFVAGCTTGGSAHADPLLCPRVGVDGRDSRLAFRLKTSRAGRALRSSPAGNALARVGRTARAVAAGQSPLRQT